MNSDDCLHYEVEVTEDGTLWCLGCRREFTVDGKPVEQE